jgi:hypothetical protein
MPTSSTIDFLQRLRGALLVPDAGVRDGADLCCIGKK